MQGLDEPVPDSGAKTNDDSGALKAIDRDDLARNDGRYGRYWIACNGLVYDVSDSPEWREGLHRSLHWAGQDLSAELADAPHGIETIQRMPLMGRLVD